VPEALDQLSGVLVQKTASGHGSPYIRGFTGNRTLLVIDGVRYNNATFRDGANEYFAQIDSFALSQIELISGPSSALYGSEAVGGVLNLATRQTGIFDNPNGFVGGEQSVRVSSGDHSLVSRSVIDVGRGAAWGLRAGVTLRDYGDVRAAELGTLPNTGYNEQAVDARLDVALGPDWLLTIKHQRLWQDDVPRTHSTIFAVPFEGTSIGSDLLRKKDHERSLTYLKLRGGTESPWLRAIEITASYQSRKEEEERLRGDALRIDQGFDSDLFALSAVATAELGKTELTYGMDLSRENVDSERSDTDTLSGTVTQRLQGPVGDDARYDQAGLFVRAVHELTPTLSFDASLRGSLVDARIGRFTDPVTGLPITFADDWSNLSGSLRLQWQRDQHTVWGGYSRSFRAPNIADISRFGRSRSSEIEVASLDLVPETFDTFELGYRFQTDAIQGGANAYTTSLNNYIATLPTGQMRDGLTEVTKQNAATGRISGVELWLNAELGSSFAVDGNATWLRGRLTAPTATGLVEEPISRIQPLTGNLALKWERNSLWAAAELQVVARADELSSGDLLDTQRIPPGGTPGYTLINLRGGTEIGQGLALTLSFNNLLDQAYRAHGSGSNEPGRHVIAGVRLQF